MCKLCFILTFLLLSGCSVGSNKQTGGASLKIPIPLLGGNIIDVSIYATNEQIFPGNQIDRNNGEHLDMPSVQPASKKKESGRGGFIALMATMLGGSVFGLKKLFSKGDGDV